MAAKTDRERSFPSLVDGLDDDTRGTAIAVRNLVLECMPDAEETIHGGSKVGLALYGLRSNGNVVCGIQPRDAVCLVYFHRVARTDSQLPLEGKGTHSLHVKISALDAATLAEVRALLHLARERAESA
jgi:hypothetical protein